MFMQLFLFLHSVSCDLEEKRNLPLMETAGKE